MVKNLFRLIFYLIGFVVVGVVVIFLAVELVDFNKAVEVPSLVGRSIHDAERLLNDKGLFLKVEGENYDAEIPEGAIIKQDVRPGEKIRQGTDIKVVVSKGAEMFSMPSFEGQLLDEAKLTLINLDIEVGKIIRVHSDTVEKGRIIAQRPLPGSIGSNRVNFVVSLGHYSVSYRCPSFVNMTVDDARDLAEALGLKLIEQKDGSRVIFQKPEAGTILKRGDSVEITLGRGWGLWF